MFIVQGTSDISDLPAGTFADGDGDNQSEGEDSPSPYVDPSNDESSSSALFPNSRALDYNEPTARSLQQQDTTSGADSSSIANLITMGESFEGEQNVNPAMNSRMGTPGNVQVMNVLDVPQASNTLEQFAMADFGLLEGIPGGMFDWGMSLGPFTI